MAERIIRGLRDGAFIAKLPDGSEIAFRGLAAKLKCDEVQAAAGYKPVGDWQDGERQYELDPTLVQAAQGRKALDEAIRQYNERQVRGLPAGPRPTYESLTAAGGRYVPPMSEAEKIAAMTDEEKAEWQAKRDEWNARFKEGIERPGYGV
ncbi:MAG: hypothetical protein ACLPUG_13705 [Acidimicrobiales bacterium]